MEPKYQVETRGDQDSDSAEAHVYYCRNAYAASPAGIVHRCDLAGKSTASGSEYLAPNILKLLQDV